MKSCRACVKNARSRGFNLVEAAIVLGVIGLVIGGIWTAAASVSFNNNINRTLEMTGFIISNVRTLYPRHNPTGMTLFTGNLLTTVAPAGTVQGNVLRDAFGSPMTVTINGNTIIIYYANEKQNIAFCNTMASRLTAAYNSAGPSLLTPYVVINTDGEDLTSVNAAGTNCVSGKAGIGLFVNL